ncbi:ATP-binding protein [Streptomyces tendae]|uniref:ATP-binding protein n=1 Tax=Streptomyces tendae TaxID=1932 RepID=UPI0037182845
MTPLVGRAHPAAVLDAAVARTLSSHGGLVLLTGEAGIGKTVLAAQTAAHAGRSGALIATGTCWDRPDAPAHWPWTQVLRGLRRAMTAEAWEAARAEAGPELGPLLGEPGGPAHGGEGFGLRDSVSTLLVAAARRHPVVVVLDDLQWADPQSLELLEFVTRHAWFERLLVIGAYRDVEVEVAGHPLGPLLSALLSKATPVTLTALDADEVRTLLARTAGREPSAATAAEVHRRTGGNPFFVEQTARLWRSTGAVDLIAPGVRDAVGQRLRLLPEAVSGLLAAASVLGPEFDREVLVEMTGQPERSVAALLREAVTARLVVPRDEPGRLGFVHDLVRETLYEGLTGEALAGWHAAAAEALTALPKSAARAAPGEAAHHAYRGVERLTAPVVVGMLRAAAAEAWDRMASKEAGVHLSRALTLVPRSDGRRWATMALDLGSARHHAGDEAAALRMFQEAAVVARALGDGALLTRAALRLRRAVWMAHPPEVERLATELVNEAYAALFGAAGSARSDLDRERELTERAAELARRAGDDEALQDALMTRHDALWGLGTAPQRQAVAEELSAVATRCGDRSVALLASLLRAMALLEQGDPASRTEQRSALAGAGHEEGAPDTVLWSEVAFAVLEGRFEAAWSALDRAEAAERGRREAGARGDSATMLFQQRWTLEVARGRFDAADELVAGVGPPQAGLLLGVTAAERGDTAAARHHVSRIGAVGAGPSRWFEPLWLRLRAQLAAADGDRAEREQVRAELAPLAGGWLTMFGSSVDGPVDYWAALLDAADGDWRAAVDGLTAAERAAEAMGAAPWVARVRRALAEALAARGGPGDAERSATLAASVANSALASIPASASVAASTSVADPASVAASTSVADPASVAASASVADAAEAPGPVSPSQAGPGAVADDEAVAGDAVRNVFRFDGQVWTLTFSGVTTHLPDAKGLHDIRRLLDRPGREVSAAELLAAENGAPVRAADLLGADPVLDERAKAAYRARITRLDESIEAALARGDDGRAAELDRERAVLIDEVRRATGLHGRPRRLGDQAERTRKAVTERIRNALRRLDRRHPALAQHLRESLVTGSACRYAPREPMRWER